VPTGVARAAMVSVVGRDMELTESAGGPKGK